MMPYKDRAKQLEANRRWYRRKMKDPEFRTTLREYRKIAWRKWYLKHRDTDRFRRMRLARTQKYRHSRADVARTEVLNKYKYDRQHPERIVAARAVTNAIRTGKLKRPSRCQNCGKRPKQRADGLSGLQAHHANYLKPLKVRWLCKFCHGATRRKY